jgi:hypothetical protein
MDEAASGLSYENSSISCPPLMPLALNNFINSRNRHNYRNNRNAERMA